MTTKGKNRINRGNKRDLDQSTPNPVLFEKFKSWQNVVRFLPTLTSIRI